MLGEGLFKDGANRFDMMQPTEIIQVPNVDPRKNPRRPPHWRQAFPIWGIGQGGRIPNFFNR